MDNLAAITTRFKSLSTCQQDMIIKEIEQLLTASAADVREKQSTHHQSCGPSCPECQSTNFRRNGHQQGQQVYLCKDCGRQYRQSSGTFISWLKKPELLHTYIRHMLQGHSLRKCADLTNISLQTSFDWRHKVLTAIGKVNQDVTFSGIVESDEIFIAHSEKGNKNLTRSPRKRGKSLKVKKQRGIGQDQVAVISTVDRQGNQSFVVATRGRISKSDIDKVLSGKLAKDATLCTDSHRSYTAFSKSNKLKHVKINASKGQIVKGIYHVQHVNQKASDLRDFIRSFKGVSTKYLQNYLNWYTINEKLMKNTIPAIAAIEMAVKSTTAWQDFMLIRSGALII
jgi:transposase-like protein